MVDLPTLVSFILASTLLCLAPGPDNLFVLTQSLVNGKRAGLAITLGICTGLIAHTAAVVLGVAALFQASPVAFEGLKVVGAMYLLYLAYGAFRAKGSKLDQTTDMRRSDSEFFRIGAIMNMTNPKVAIFFLAFLPAFVSADENKLSFQLAMLGVIFIGIAAIVFGSIAVLAAKARSLFNDSENSQLILNRLSGIVFITMACKLFVSEL